MRAATLRAVQPRRNGIRTAFATVEGWKPDQFRNREGFRIQAPNLADSPTGQFTVFKGGLAQFQRERIAGCLRSIQCHAQFAAIRAEFEAADQPGCRLIPPTGSSKNVTWLRAPPGLAT